MEYITLLMREREKYNEGKAEGLAKGLTEGLAKGIIDFALDLGYSSEQILSILQKKLDIDIVQAEGYLQKFHDGN